MHSFDEKMGPAKQMQEVTGASMFPSESADAQASLINSKTLFAKGAKLRATQTS